MMGFLFALFVVAFLWLLAIELRFQGLKALVEESKMLARQAKGYGMAALNKARNDAEKLK